jgi:hypothetical protein
MLKGKKTISCLVLLLCFSVVTAITQPTFSFAQEVSLANYLPVTEKIDKHQAYLYLEKLCSEEFEGRQTGTKGGVLSAEWIRDMFQGFGLKPASAKDSSYLQTYRAPCFNLLPEVSFMLTTKDGNEPFVYKQDFVPSPGSGSGTATGVISFVGYGISNPEMDYDDYKGIDVKNKIVLLLRKAPTSISLPETDSYFTTKISNAKEHGAIGVIIVEKEGEKNPYSMLSKSTTGSLNSDIPAVFVPVGIANQILAPSDITVLELQKKIDDSQAPASMSVKAGAYIKVTMSVETKETSNVVGFIPSEDPNREESILITAHYDHLGKDLVNGDFYPGANDNASGTAVLLETARVLSSNCYIPSINIVFIAFSGEEEGLLGSAYYIENPMFPLDKTLAVLNMDMAGTGTGDIYAGTKFPDLIKMIENSADILKMKVPISKNLVYGGSDQLLFARKNIPAVFFIRSNPTGLGDYHTPLDTVDTVDPENLAQQARLILMVVSGYANPKTLIFNTQTDYWFKGLSYHERVILRAKGTVGTQGKIQNQEFRIPDDGSLEKIIVLKEGINLVQIHVVNANQEVIFETMISITAKIIPELDADFNFDQVVDFYDLLLFSRNYPKNQFKTAIEELCDLNLDQVVDEKDFIWFKKRYDYKLEK